MRDWLQEGRQAVAVEAEQSTGGILGPLSKTWLADLGPALFPPFFLTMGEQLDSGSEVGSCPPTPSGALNY